MVKFVICIVKEKLGNENDIQSLFGFIIVSMICNHSTVHLR